MNDDNMMEKRVVLNIENQFLHNHIEDLIVKDYSCKGREWIVLDLSFIPKLRLLQVGNECLSQSICCLLKTRVFLEKNICCKLVYTGCKTSPSDGIFTKIGTLLSLLRLNNRVVHLPINVVKMDFQRVDGAVLEAISTTEPTIHAQSQLLPI